MKNNHGRECIAKALAILGEVFNKSITPITIRAYEIGLEGISDADLERIVKTALNTCKFMPPPAVLRELAGEAVLTSESRAVRAWEAFALAHRKHGFYASVDFDDKLINATVRNLGGWERVDERLDEEGEVWVRKEFERIYSTFCATGISADRGGALVGHHDRMNASNGFADQVKGPILILTGLPPHPGVPKIAAPRARRQIASEVDQMLDSVGKMPE